MTRCPYVESSKQEKFKAFLSKFLLKLEIAEQVQDIIFPYTDEDAADLDVAKGEAGKATIFLKFNSLAEVVNASLLLDNRSLTKVDMLTAIPQVDLYKVLNMEQELSEVDLMSLVEWEFDKIEEVYMTRRNNGNPLVTVHSLNFLRKTTTQIGEFKADNKNTLCWTPMGKYVVVSDRTSFTFLSGKDFRELNTSTINVINFKLSSDEKYLITYSGKIFDAEREDSYVWRTDKMEIVRGFTNGDDPFDQIAFDSSSKYLARLKNPDRIIVYEAPLFTMVADKVGRKQPISSPSISKLEWLHGTSIILTTNIVRVKIDPKEQRMKQIEAMKKKAAKEGKTVEIKEDLKDLEPYYKLIETNNYLYEVFV